jgi:hypothetical protein
VTESWKMSLKTPIGPQDMVLNCTRDGDGFTGRIESEMGSDDVTDGKIDGETLRWTMDVTKPVKLTISFEVQQEGDTLTGNAKLGMFGNAPITGQRA